MEENKRSTATGLFEPLDEENSPDALGIVYGFEGADELPHGSPSDAAASDGARGSDGEDGTDPTRASDAADDAAAGRAPARADSGAGRSGGKRGRRRSRITFPYKDLETSVEYTGILLGCAGWEGMSLAERFDATYVKRHVGKEALRQRVNDAVKFGLVRREGGTEMPTDLGEIACRKGPDGRPPDPTERETALQRAFLTVRLYDAVYHHFDGPIFGNDAALTEFMILHGVDPAINHATIIGTLQRSARFARLMDVDGVRLLEPKGGRIRSATAADPVTMAYAELPASGKGRPYDQTDFAAARAAAVDAELVPIGRRPDGPRRPPPPQRPERDPVPTGAGAGGETPKRPEDGRRNEDRREAAAARDDGMHPVMKALISSIPERDWDAYDRDLWKRAMSAGIDFVYGRRDRTSAGTTGAETAQERREEAS